MRMMGGAGVRGKTRAAWMLWMGRQRATRGQQPVRVGIGRERMTLIRLTRVGYGEHMWLHRHLRRHG